MPTRFCLHLHPLFCLSTRRPCEVAASPLCSAAPRSFAGLTYLPLCCPCTCHPTSFISVFHEGPVSVGTHYYSVYSEPSWHRTGIWVNQLCCKRKEKRKTREVFSEYTKIHNKPSMWFWLRQKSWTGRSNSAQHMWILNVQQLCWKYFVLSEIYEQSNTCSYIYAIICSAKGSWWFSSNHEYIWPFPLFAPLCIRPPPVLEVGVWWPKGHRSALVFRKSLVGIPRARPPNTAAIVVLCWERQNVWVSQD